MIAPELIDQHRPDKESAKTRSLYFDLSAGKDSARVEAVSYLENQLSQAEKLVSDLPNDAGELGDWMARNTEEVGKQYQQYLDGRNSGQPRRYFRNKSHALYFLKAVAPTKLVDGAWLYGLLERWQDNRFLSLIQTYLEELGEGVPAQNHVALYKRLLARYDCQQWKDLSDEHFVQGAIQLSLAYNADQFLPEVIGFNLGYEQLPLHLLITAYELKELGIDPYYFTLHITVDNGDNGHAKKAVEAVTDAMPKLGDAKEFYRRVRNGYMLNSLGVSTNKAIAAYDIDQEMVEIFSRKGVIGRYAHADYRQIAGRSITDWLSDPDQSMAVIQAMETEGWFKRHQNPENSRFWKLIAGDKAKMAGVFNAYEKQAIYDWIVGDSLASVAAERHSNTALPSQLTFEQKQKLYQISQQKLEDVPNEFDAETRKLQAELASSEKQEATMGKLIAMMSPANHHTSAGLMATRIFNDIVN